MLLILKILVIFIHFKIIICAPTASLTFVIDNTRSMHYNIDQVKKSADSIMDIVFQEKSTQIKNIVLITFNDPDVRLVKKTDSRQEFMDALSSVDVDNYFNDDCPEMALKGVKLGLEESLPGSYIYVLTDAIAKDFKLVNAIKVLCERTQSQVSFIVTGDCHRPNSKGNKVYYEIAAASSGQVFRVKKNEVDSVLNTIRETIRGKQCLLTSKIIPPNVSSEVPFTVVDATQYVTVSVSGLDVTLEITGPTTDFEKIMWKTNGKVVKIPSPEPGDYIARVSGSSATSVAVHARSDFSFQYGFSEEIPVRIEDTSRRPTADVNNYLAVSTSDPNNEVRVEDLQILDMDENVISEYPLKKVSENFYTTKPFVTPADSFKIAVKGATNAGKPFRMIAKNSVAPQPPPPGAVRPKGPEVTIAEGLRTAIDFGSSHILTCRVTGYPKPMIVWKDDEGNPMASTTSMIDPPYGHVSYLKLEDVRLSKKYYCHATNSLGRDLQIIDVVAGDTFTIQPIPPEIVHVKQGNEVTLKCNIQSTFPMQITWYHVDESNAKARLMSSSKYTISRDETELLIKAIDVNNAGKYICRASLLSDDNISKEFTINVKLAATVAPVIDKTTTTIEVEENGSVTIPCKILQGIPFPEIRWDRNMPHVHEFDPADLPAREVTQKGLAIFNLEVKHSGEYMCIATNSAGQDEHITTIIVLKKPEIMINEGPQVTATYGSTVSITCTVTANPAPSIDWKDENGTLVPTSPMNYEMKTDFKYAKTLTITNVVKSIRYYCISQNTQGQVVSTVEVNVESPFIVTSYPSEILNVEQGKSATLKCDIASYLPMKITWSFMSSDSAVTYNITSPSEKYLISWDQTELTITSMDFDLIGYYRCKASLLFDEEQSKYFITEIKLQKSLTPKIADKTSTKLTVEENSPAVIHCKVEDAKINARVRWEYKGFEAHSFVPISQFGEELRIPNTVIHSAGFYRCVAENAMGSDDKITELIVNKKPVVTILEGTATNLLSGNELVLTCKVTAFPFPTITWFDRQGVIMSTETPTASNAYESTSILKIPNIKKTETYHCVAENLSGKSSGTTDVSVESPFTVLESPEPITNAEYGTPLTINCDIRSHLPKTITWYRLNNKSKKKMIIRSSEKYSISEDETTLVIKSVDLESAGKYTCNASLIFDKNEFKSFETDVKVKGLLKPKIDKSSTIVKVKENGQAVIDCSIITGTPVIKLTWHFKSRESDEFIAIPGNEEEMKIPKALLHNSGYYQCIAENAAGSDEKVTELIVNKIPIASITEGEKINKQYGRELSITCKVIAYPDPVITWKDHRGSVLTAETIPEGNQYEYTSQLTIPNMKKSAKFYCHAENDQGEDTVGIDVIVQSMLTVDSEVTLDLEYGKSATLTCGIKSRGPKITEWTYFSKVTNKLTTVRTSEKYSLSWDGSKLTIRSMDFNLVGKYSCKSSLLFDPEEYAIHDTIVKIKGLIPPKFDKSHNSIEVKENMPAIIECKLLEGTPKPTISWHFKVRGSDDFVPIPGFEEYLQIPSAILNNVGTYKCVAENSAGEDDKTTELIVAKTPLVTIIEGNSLKVSYDTELTLTCKVTAYPAPTIFWSSDEEEFLKSENGPEVDGFEYTSRLKISGVKKPTNYSCNAVNNQEKVTENITVNVDSPFQVVQYPKEWINVEFGTEHKIKCIIKSDYKMKMQWFHTDNNKEVTQILSTSNKYHLSSDDNELTIKFMDSEYVGKYTCKASLIDEDNIFKALETNLFLGGLEAPQIQQTQAVMKIKAQENAIIPCKILKGNPKPAITWYYKKLRTDTFESIHKSDEELNIVSASQTHVGYYKCVAKNKVGEDEATTELIVEANTAYNDDVHNIYLQEGDTKRIKCQVPHTDLDSIKWYKDGKDLMETGQFLTLSQVDVTASGQYICQVMNSHGSPTDTYNVDVGYAPVFKTHMDSYIIDWNGSGQLDCEAKAKPEPKVEWTHNGAPVDVSTDTTNLHITGWGQYVCKISNVHGSLTRTINVISKGCLINRNKESLPNTPLLLNLSSSWPSFGTENEYLVMEPGAIFKLSCHDRDSIFNSFQKFPTNYVVEASCNRENTYWVDGKLYEYTNFHCENVVLPSVIVTDNECFGEDTKVIRVGFNVEEFIEVYQVCFETKISIPLYVRYMMQKANGKIDTKNMTWLKYHNIGDGKINLEYTCENDMSKVCYGRTQLVNALDVYFGPSQTSTFIDHINAVPLWKPCDGSERMTWQEIEDAIRCQMKDYNITIIAGVSDYKYRPGAGNIPRFLWKVVKFDESEATAIIYVNDPAPVESDKRCRNTCFESSGNWIESKDPYTYCCDLDDFLTAFRIPDKVVGL